MEVEKDPKFVALKEQQTRDAERAARAEEQLILNEAKGVVAEKLQASTLPEITRKRVETKLLKESVPSKDGKLDAVAFEQTIKEAIDHEVEYLAELTGAGKITGMGGTHPSTENLDAPLTEAFKRLGHDDAAAKIAVAGRK